MTAYLASRFTTLPQLQRVLGVSTTAFGQQVGTACTYTSGGDGITNLSCYFRGALFRLTAGNVYRSVDDGTTQTSVLALTGGVNTAQSISLGGPYVVYDSSGVPRLTVFWLDGGNIFRFAHSQTGLSGSWTTVTPGVNPFAMGGFPVVVQGVISFYYSATMYQINPGGASLTSFAGGFGLPSSVYQIVWNNTLYTVSSNNGGASPYQLRRMTGGISTNVLSIVATTSTWCAAWVDPSTNNLITVFRDTTGAAVRAFEITPGLVSTEVTSAMIASGVLSTFGDAAKVVGVFYDQDSNPGGAPAIYLLIASAATSGTSVSMFKYNGVATVMGAAGGVPDDTGGNVEYAWPDKNVGGERFFTPRPVGVDGTPEIVNTGKGALGTGISRRKFALYAPRSQVLTTLGGAAAYNLATTPLADTPVAAGYTTIKGTIGAVAVVAQDDGAGAFPVSALLPAGGTITTGGVMTGVTAVLDAGSTVEALYVGGTASNQWYRALATNAYPENTTKAPLTLPTSGAVVSDDNTGCTADGTEQQISVGMSGFTAGNRVSFEPRAFT